MIKKPKPRILRKTLREVIITDILIYNECKLRKLIAIEAPKALIKPIRHNIEELNRGVLNIHGQKDLLDTIYQDHEVLIGRNGKEYIAFNEGTILYFPNAQHGRYIKRANKER